MKRRKNRKRPPGSPRRPKISDRVLEVGGGFINVGDTTEERASRLNAVCSAWNMAGAGPELRQEQLRQYLDSYRAFNAGTSDSDLADIRSDIEALIKRKLQLFPEDRRQIFDARLIPHGQDYRIEIAAASLPATVD